MTLPSGVQCQKCTYRLTLLGVSRYLPTLQTTLIMITISVISTMQISFGKTQYHFRWCLFNATSKQFIWFVALGPQGGDSRSYLHMIHCFSGWGRDQTATLGQLLDGFPHSWSFFSSSRMLHWALKGFLPWFKCLQQGRYVRLLVWRLSRRGFNFRCNPCTM